MVSSAPRRSPTHLALVYVEAPEFISSVCAIRTRFPAERTGFERELTFHTLVRLNFAKMTQMDNKFILNQKYAKKGTIQARIERRKQTA
jgi:hypothetical protein